MKVAIIDDVPVALEDDFLTQMIDDGDEREALLYSFGLGERRAEEMELRDRWLDEEDDEA